MQPQEELAALFSRNLTFNPIPPSIPEPAPAPAPVQAPQEENKIVYISQHYNHSAHIVRPETQPPRSASEPPQSEHAIVERVLKEHSVDPSGLSSAQLQLFKTVDSPEKLRLIELWRVCPPTNSNDNPTLAWGMTTVDQEEALARMRYEQQQQQAQQQAQQQQQQQQQQQYHEQETVMSLDGTPLTPIQAGDGRWIGMAEMHHDMEPYMAQGYEEMARRPEYTNRRVGCCPAGQWRRYDF
ncbi:hypothetical protein BT67DRAFT_134916 [Trichocladium antarcticum]|uniref:Uncharacterized protein n=1 Tax=Trichocladium antarcticum TaxID=1450529 RepID=A0AAN6ZAQ2_9PEZI|nr:hypothetical protein BT67DRAFT_134916 [Trichocladium antarcticum]